MGYALITYKAAKDHLGVSDDGQKALILRLMDQATAIVLDRISRDPATSPAWTVDTDGASDPTFLLVQAAIGYTLAEMWRHRGDDDVEPVFNPNAQGYLNPRAEAILFRLYGPPLA